MKKIFPYILALPMLAGAVAHVVMPAAYEPMIPSFIPSSLANILAAVAELIVGIALVIPKYQKKGGMLFMALMIAFLPIHIWDMLRDNPAIGEPPAPLIRVAVQFLLIYAGWWIHKKF